MKIKQEAKEKFPELDLNFTFHDLKAKGISDLSGNLYDKQALFEVIKTLSRTARYNRRIAVVPVVGGQ